MDLTEFVTARLDQCEEMFYVLVCRRCSDPGRPLPLPFDSAAERAKWAAEHTWVTGHEEWLVRDERRSA